MSAATADRTYWHVPGARSWHAAIIAGADTSVCGRYFDRLFVKPDESDRVPSNGHLCGSCARVIAARTDIEPGFTGAPV